MNKKQTNKISFLRKNRGFAILFSLSILSLVLVVVMIFASRAEVASHVSAIHMENQSARALAKSLVPRIMFTINNSQDVQDQYLFSSIYDHENTSLISAHRDLYTYDWIWKLEHPAHFKFTPTSLNSNGSVTIGSFRYYAQDKAKNAPEFDVRYPYFPTWQYILDIPHPDSEDSVDGTLPKTERGVIARFAYIIIPKIAHINPNAIADHTLCTKLSASSAKAAGVSHDTCRKCARKLGNSPSELMFGQPSGMGGTVKNTGDGYYINSPLAADFVENKNEPWGTIQDFLKVAEITPPSLDASEKEVDNYINGKNAVTRFMEIDNAGDREAFWSDDGDPDEKDPNDNNKQLGEDDGVRDTREFYHRFNMRRTDWENLNISDIKKDPKEWSDLEKKEPTITGNGDRDNHDTGGIPWLANWKDEGDWGDKDDTQNQVIANLLNYCSPPTRPVVSNVKPENWKNEQPKYTGLKRTLYINEVFFDVKFKTDVQGINYSDAEDKSYVDVVCDFSSDFMVELIDMYLNTLGDNNNNPVEFGTTMKESDFSRYKPEVYGTLTYEIYNPKSAAWETKSLTIEGDLNGLDFKRFEDTDKVEEIPVNSRQHGYYGYVANYTEQFDFSYEADGKVTESQAYSAIKISNLSLKVDKVLLYRTPTDDELLYVEGNSNVAKNRTFPKNLTDNKEYVDCAFFDNKFKGENMLPSTAGNENGTALLSVCNDWEAVDPRQNLRSGDWTQKIQKVYKTQTAYEGKASIHTLPIQEYITADGQSTAITPVVTNNSLKLAGNSPRAKKAEENKQDFEVASDPSWQLVSGKKVEPTKLDSHISTAYIRHAVLRRTQNKSDEDKAYPLVEYPMESLWELGAIHRGSKWQTLNISKSPLYSSAKDFVKQGADKYEDGDGPILDQVKMTNDAITFGKINLVRHVDMEVRDMVIGSLFRDMPVHTGGYYLSQGLNANGLEDRDLFPNKSFATAQVRIHDKDDPDSGLSDPTVDAPNTNSEAKKKWQHASYVAALYDVLYGDGGYEKYLQKPNSKKFWRRSDFLAAPKNNSGSSVEVDDILWPIRQNYDYTTDAMEEQIIGRTINLMKIESTVKGATAILIVQTLKDSARRAPTGGSLDTTVYRDWNSDGIINQSNEAPDEERKSKLAQHQAGYRRFTDVEDSDLAFIMPPLLHSEKITSKLGTYENGADSITGETKVIITLDFDTATQKWKMVKYEYAD